MKYLTDSKFDQELKSLSKKFRSLPGDFKILKEFSIEFFHNSGIKDKDSILKIEGCCNDRFESYVIKKIACRSLKGRGCKSGFRITYILDKTSDVITFMEIYFKSDKEVEDKERLKKYIRENN